MRIYKVKSTYFVTFIKLKTGNNFILWFHRKNYNNYNFTKKKSVLNRFSFRKIIHVKNSAQVALALHGWDFFKSPRKVKNMKFWYLFFLFRFCRFLCRCRRQRLDILPVPAAKEITGKTACIYIIYSKFWSVSLEHFIERKPFIYEEGKQSFCI